ncbi:DNA polymerase-3 subunit beta [Enterococcus sp. PF1-24]|uniref:DNA polymerase III subunit beta n=1 Tax=unclassified Enterococcus TaxID=2608891 RepID=UPI0024749502|nr:MULTISPECIES: DNA polymerase III subunit beta [unclassified Enterococcus]MDH6364341.1 DNA polymerase-3 subunit beta [Enterococcus sp. PFB1-1]MDH6401470.1 DNA polymerase-3 subunit beta [Enterococcus sp. PF1-24]
MKFSISRNIFMQELQTVQRAIAAKTTIPILTGLKIELNSEGLNLTGSNGDISIETILPLDDADADLQVESPGTIVVQARFFNDIIRKLPEDHFSLEVMENHQVNIVSGKANFLINGLDAANYPLLPIIETNSQFELPVHSLNQIIKETVFSVSAQENRPILTGVHFILKDHILTAVATDSHRLSQRQIPITQEVQEIDIVIPGKTLIELSRSLTDEEELVEISIMENQVLFRTAKMYFYSRLLEGNYPDTNPLIPTSFNTEIEFSVPMLLSAIERASLLSHEGRNNIVRLSVKEDSVVLYGNSPEIGKVEEDLNFESITGEAIEISFNPDYMKEALRAFGGIDIVVKFVSSVRPFILEPVENDAQFIQLITPVRTR